MIGIALLGAGLVEFVYELLQVVLWIRAIPQKARIVAMNDETWNDGMLRFCYEFQQDYKTITIWGPWHESFNPLLCIWPQRRLGKVVSVRINEQKMKIIQKPWVSMLFGMIGVGVALCGFIVLWSVQLTR